MWGRWGERWCWEVGYREVAPGRNRSKAGWVPLDCTFQTATPRAPSLKLAQLQSSLWWSEVVSEWIQLPVVNLEISIIRGKDTVSDISNEHKELGTSGLQCGLLSILIVWVFLLSLPPLSSGTFPSGCFILLDRLVKALFFPPNSLVSLPLSPCFLYLFFRKPRKVMCSSLIFFYGSPFLYCKFFCLWSLKYPPQGQNDSYSFLCWEKVRTPSWL